MSIGNCPRCGAPSDDENELCYQCALRRVAAVFNETDCDDVSISAHTSHSDEKRPRYNPEQCEHLNSIGHNDYDRYCFDCQRELINYDRY